MFCVGKILVVHFPDLTAVCLGQKESAVHDCHLLHVEENISKMAELLSVFDWVIALYLMGFGPILSGLHHVLGLGLIFGPGDDSFQL